MHIFTIGDRATLHLRLSGSHRVKIVGARIDALSDSEPVTRDNLELEVVFTGRCRERLRNHERRTWPLLWFSDLNGHPIRFRHCIPGEAREVV